MPEKGTKGSSKSIVISALLSLKDDVISIISGSPEKILLTAGKVVYKSLTKGETPEKVLRNAVGKAVEEWKPRLKGADRANLVSGLVSAVGEIGSGTSIADTLDMFDRIKKEAVVPLGKGEVRSIISTTTRNGYALSEDQAKEVYPLILKNLIEISRKYENTVSNEELMRVLYHNLVSVKDIIGNLHKFDKEEIKKIEDISKKIKTGHKEIADGIDNLRSLALAEREFELLSGKILPEQDLRDAFFYGKEANWTDIILERDIERDCYQQLFQSVCRTFEDENGLSVMFPVRGDMGSGKSTVLKRLSYDFYYQGNHVFYRNIKPSIGLNLSGDIKALIETARQRNIKKYYIVIDNAQHLERGDFSGCLENITKMKPEERAVVIMSARPEGWRKLSPETATAGSISWLKNEKGKYWEIENTIEDRMRLAENLRDHGIIDDEALVAAKVLSSKPVATGSLIGFLIIITLKGPEGSDHINRILNQFKELSPEERFAYFACALFHRYDVTFSEELLLHITKSEAVKQSTLESLRGKCILFRNNEGMVFSKHPLFSSIIFQNARGFLKTCDMQEEEFQELQSDIYKNLFDTNRRLDQDEKGVVSYFQISDVYNKLSDSVINSIIKYSSEILKDDISDEKARLNAANSSTFGWGPLLGRLSEIIDDPLKKDIIFLEEKHYKRVLELKDDFPQAYNNYAVLLEKTGQLEEAEVYYKRALELREEDAEVHNNYGFLLANTGRPEEAEVHIKRALELREEYPEAHYMYANLLVWINRPEEAEVHYKRALVLKDNFPMAHNNYGFLLVTINHLEEAEVHFKRAIELQKDYAEAYTGLGLLYTVDSFFNINQAEINLKKAIELALNQGKLDIIKNILNILTVRQSKDKRLEPLVNELDDFYKKPINGKEGR